MEKDLYEPIKNYLEELGYEVDGEVKTIDLVAIKDGISVAVELKNELNLRLLEQCGERQKYVDYVFAGIWMPKNLRSKAFQNKVYLLKRLGIGLFLVSKRSLEVTLYNKPEIIPLDTFRVNHKAKGKAVWNEFEGRRVKETTGGVSGQKIISAYKEESLLVVEALANLGGKGTCKDIKTISGVLKTTNILRDNYEGYFIHESRGVYALSEKGYKAREDFKELIKKMRN